MLAFAPLMVTFICVVNSLVGTLSIFSRILLPLFVTVKVWLPITTLPEVAFTLLTETVVPLLFAVTVAVATVWPATLILTSLPVVTALNWDRSIEYSPA